MKKRVKWLAIPALVLCFGACKKKEEAKAPEAATPGATAVVPEIPTPAPKPEVPALGAEERAAKLGFVNYLPQDTEAVISVHNGGKISDRVTSSKLWALVQEEMAGGGDAGMEDPGMEVPEEMPEGEAIPEPEEAPAPEEEDAVPEPELPEGGDIRDESESIVGQNLMLIATEGPEAAQQLPEELIQADEGKELLTEEEPFGPAALLGTEVTIAFGKSAGEQGANLLTAYRRSNYFQMKALAKAFVEAAKSGDSSAFGDALVQGMGDQAYTEVLKDPESGIGLLERTTMPPLYIAMRVSESQRAAAAQQVASSLAFVGMLGDVISPLEFEKAGQKFAGYKISGAKISESMAANRESMQETIDPELFDKLLAVIAKKDLVIVSGTIGEYVVLFVGASEEAFALAAGSGESLVAGDTLAFADAYASKELAVVSYGRKESLETLMKSAGGLSDMAKGLRDGFAGTEGLGDTRDLEAMLQIVAEREDAVLKLATVDASGMVAFFEEGLKIESFGGSDSGLVDWKTPAKLAHLGNSPDVVLFANMTTDAVYDEKARAYFEALFETAYAMTMKLSEVPMEEGDLTQYKEMAKMFDGKFRSDVIALWDAWSVDFAGGLGLESALVIDLKGTVPTLPGIPQPVVDKGRFPRATMVFPVTDRAKLASAWDKMNVSSTGIMAKISEMTGKEIPMQKPISSEKNGNTTWFFPMPFFNDDFMPSVTVGDKFYAASSSKLQALDLLAKAAEGGETRNGLWFTLNFKALQEYSAETLKLVEENAVAIFGEEGMAEENKEIARKTIEALADLDAMTLHVRREGPQLRSSFHLKTR